MVTHSSTSRPVQCLCMAERTGCPVLTDLWSYVLDATHICFTKKLFQQVLLVQCDGLVRVSSKVFHQAKGI
jgi:hypothetical protein